MPEADELPRRELMEYDVVIVGAGPAGLAAAMRLKQREANRSVVVVEKGSAVGAHILSGAVIDPIGLDRLVPDWRADAECPLKTQVSEDRFYYLSETRSLRLPNWPMPRLMNNHGNFVGSLGALTRWLAARAEALGVEIYPGFAATELLYGEKGEVVGVATGDMGISRDGKPKPSFTRGMELKGKYVLLAEGARGSLAKAAAAEHHQMMASSREQQARAARGVTPTDFPSIGVPWLVQTMTSLYGRKGVADAMPNLANLVISNVPGPQAPLYAAGARMETYWPLNMVQHGQAPSITAMSYAGDMDFGFTTVRSAIPDARELSATLLAALDELVASSGIAPAKRALRKAVSKKALKPERAPSRKRAS